MDELTSATLQHFTTHAVAASELASELTRLGWTPVRSGPARVWQEWRNGERVGYTGEDPTLVTFEMVETLARPEEGADFDQLYWDFEARFAALTTDVMERLNAPSLTSEFDEPPLPVSGQFDRGAVWERPGWSVMVSFQHEDKEVPLRLAVWLFRNHQD